MGNSIFILTIGLLLYFLYGSLVFWVTSSILLAIFISLMFIDINFDEPQQSITHE